MRPRFPGMDPWLEDPELWPNVHNSLVISIRDVLSRQVRPRYFVDVESRMTVLSGTDQDHMYHPDVAICAADLRLAGERGRCGLDGARRGQAVPCRGRNAA